MLVIVVKNLLQWCLQAGFIAQESQGCMCPLVLIAVASGPVQGREIWHLPPTEKPHIRSRASKDSRMAVLDAHCLTLCRRACEQGE